jgi:hypothetical protein
MADFLWIVPSLRGALATKQSRKFVKPIFLKQYQNFNAVALKNA